MQALQERYRNLSQLPYQSAPLAKAAATTEEVTCAIQQLRTWGFNLMSGRPCMMDKRDLWDKNESGYYLIFDRYLEKQGNYKKLETDNPLGKLVHQLAQQVLQTGTPVNFVGVRFEQGFVKGHVNWWHIDDNPGIVTIGFSNRPEWNTKIITDQKIQQLTPEVLNLDTIDNEELDKHAETALDGYFYSGARVLHRSPVATDMKGPISSDDYRLFLRFATAN